MVQTAIEYFHEDRLYNHINSVEKAYLHYSFQIYLKTPCSGLEEPQVP
jgi:hypothetical protein